MLKLLLGRELAHERGDHCKMSGYNPYGQAGYQSPSTGPPQQAQLGAQWRPPVAPPPGSHQQGGSSYGQAPPNGQQGRYGSTPHSGHPPQPDASQEQEYFPPQGQAATLSDGHLRELSAHVDPRELAANMGSLGLGSLGLGDDTTAAVRPQRKKNRHAYHNLDQPGASQQSFSGMQQGYSQPQSFNTDPSQQSGPSTPYAVQQVTPAMNQFPAQAGIPFSPGLQQQAGGAGFGAPNQPIQAPSGPGVSTQGRVDPEQIPSVPLSRDAAAKYYLDHVYPTIDQHLPPPATIPFVAFDQGNSSPKYARLTLNNIPSTSEALAATGLPLGLVLQPLALSQEGEDQIPVLDFGETGPPRCRRCRTYINPFMSFKSGGNKLVCNMCTFPNDVAPEYFAPTDPSGVRVDRAQRPELTMGTIEFMVPKEYWAKEPVGLRWLFVIDVTQEAVNRGFLEVFCSGILGALYEDDQEDSDYEKVESENQTIKRTIPLGTKVGFVTYDKVMHFYNCNVSRMHLSRDSYGLHSARPSLTKPRCS